MKGKAVLILLFIIILSCHQVNAECNNNLRSEAANVTANYVLGEVVVDNKGVEHPELDVEKIKEEIQNSAVAENLSTSDYTIVDIVLLKVYNITKNLYVTVEESTENTLDTYYYENTNDGELTIRVPDTDKIRDYKVRIFSNDNSCLNEEITSLPSVKTPMYNPYSEYEICLNQTKYYCQPYVTTEITITEEQLFAELYKEDENNNNNSEINQKENIVVKILKIGLPIGIGILALIVAIISISKKDRRSDK